MQCGHTAGGKTPHCTHFLFASSCIVHHALFLTLWLLNHHIMKLEGFYPPNVGNVPNFFQQPFCVSVYYMCSAFLPGKITIFISSVVHPLGAAVRRDNGEKSRPSGQPTTPPSSSSNVSFRDEFILHVHVELLQSAYVLNVSRLNRRCVSENQEFTQFWEFLTGMCIIFPYFSIFDSKEM